MKQRTTWLVIAFITSLLAVGIPYWVIPYDRLTLPNALMGPGLFVVGIAAFLLCASGVARFWTVTLAQAASVPAAVFMRVLADGLRDPTSHNLWPLEVVIALGVGTSGALVGAVAGSALAYYVRTRTSA